MNSQRSPQHLTKASLIIGLLFCLHLGGCGPKSDEPTVVTPPPVDQQKLTADPPAGTTDAPGQIELPPVDSLQQPPTTEPSSEGLQLPDDQPIKETSQETAKIQYAAWEEIEKFATSNGRITVVDIWSTVCAPCIKEFPGLVKLHNEHGESIQCISVDVDYDGRKSRPPESYEEAVVGFLSSVAATFPNYICQTPSEDLFKTLDVVSIPAVLIFDANGKLVKRFIDADETAGFSYEKDIIPLVTKLAG